MLSAQLACRSSLLVLRAHLAFTKTSTGLVRRFMSDSVAQKARPASTLDDSEAGTPLEKKQRLDAPTQTDNDARHSKPATNTQASAPSERAQKPTQKRQSNAKQKRKAKKHKHTLPDSGTSEDVVFKEVEELLGKQYVDAQVEAGTEWSAPFTLYEEVELLVKSMSSSGTSSSFGPAFATPQPFLRNLPVISSNPPLVCV
jgi:hypothetical protein